MRRTVASAFGLAALFVVAACSDQPRPVRVPTEPGLAKQTGSCSTDSYNTLVSEAKSLFDGAVESTALDQLKAIKNSCPNVPAAHLYDGYVITNKGAITTSRAQALSLHVDHIFAYVGAGTPSVPYQAWFLGAAICELASDATADCIAYNSPSSDVTETGLALAGLRQAANSTPLGNHLYSIVRNDTPGCLGTNLGRSTVPCYNFAVFPAVSPKFDPALIVFVCTSDHSGADITTSLDAKLRTLGHKKSVGGTEALHRYPPSGTEAFAVGCSHDAPPLYVGASPFGGALKSFLAYTLRPFRATTAYAVNGGLGITDDFADGFSPIGDVFLATFRDNFNDSNLLAEIGTWTDSVQSPGTISVESSLGSLTDTPVVLNQAHGACAQCPVLLHKGTMANSSGSPGDAGYVAADVGTYVIRFQSLQNKPSVKNAPVIVESFETSGPPSSRSKEIARLSYSTESSQSILRYNGLVVGNWVQNVHQSFEITVDMTNRTTSLRICGVNWDTGCTAPTAFQGVAFVNSAATNFNDIAWRFGGVDAGIIAVDNVSIIRAVDP